MGERLAAIESGYTDTGFLSKSRTETIGEFLHRLRPSETLQSTGDWICCENERDEDVNDASDQAEPSEKGADSEPVPVNSTGESEDDLSDPEIDEFPTERGKLQRSLRYAMERGKEILEKLVEDLRAPMRGRTKNFLRDEARQKLKQLAIETGETCGKWMLFPTIAQVDDMWAIVAKATVEGRLGISAKVCTCKEDVTTEPPPMSNKLICVYTYDFHNIDKVKRLLDSLNELGLDPHSFKLDLFSRLGIYNESKSFYGISPIIYTPRSMRQVGAETATTRPPRAYKPRFRREIAAETAPTRSSQARWRCG